MISPRREMLYTYICIVGIYLCAHIFYGTGGGRPPPPHIYLHLFLHLPPCYVVWSCIITQVRVTPLLSHIYIIRCDFFFQLADISHPLTVGPCSHPRPHEQSPALRNEMVYCSFLSQPFPACVSSQFNRVYSALLLIVNFRRPSFPLTLTLKLANSVSLSKKRLSAFFRRSIFHATFVFSREECVHAASFSFPASCCSSTRVEFSAHTPSINCGVRFAHSGVSLELIATYQHLFK